MKKLTPERDTVKYLEEKIREIPGGDELSEESVSAIVELFSELNAGNFDEIFSKIAEIDELKRSSDESKKKIDALEKLLSEYKKTADDNKKNFKEWHKRRDQEQTKIIGDATDAINKANAKNKELEGALKAANTKIKDLLPALKESQERETLLEKLREEEGKAYQSIIVKYQADISNLESKIDILVSHASTTEKRLENIEQGNRAINDKLDSVIPFINQKLSSLNSYVQQLSDYVGQLSQLTEQATGAIEGIDEMFTNFSESFSESIQAMESLVDEIKTSAKFAEDAMSKVEEASNKLNLDINNFKGQLTSFISKATEKAVKGLGDLHETTESNITSRINDFYVESSQMAGDAVKEVKKKADQKNEENQSLVTSALTRVNQAVDSLNPSDIIDAINSLRSAVEQSGSGKDGKDLVDAISGVITIVSGLQSDVNKLVSTLSQETDNVVGGEE